MASTTTTTDPSAGVENSFTYPPLYNFPPFFTRQPNDTTFSSQLTSWTTFILSYTRHHRHFHLLLSNALSSPLFNNTAISRKVSDKFAVEILEHMAKEGSVEWTDAARTGVWVWWRKPEEWAGVVGEWIESTGQKGAVLTLFELEQGEGTRREEFHGMPPYMLRKVLGIMVKRGQAQVFGTEDEMGVKFF